MWLIVRIAHGLTLNQAVNVLTLFNLCAILWIVDATPWAFWQRNYSHGSPLTIGGRYESALSQAPMRFSLYVDRV